MEFSLEGLRGYVPLTEKTAFIRETAGRCFDRIELRAAEGDASLPLPPMYQVNLEKRERYLLGGFVRLYLGQEVQPPEEDPWLISREDYDRWQTENMQTLVWSQSSEENVYLGGDCESDWRETKALFLEEVRSLEKVMNDPVTRILAAMQMQTTPEAMAQAAQGMRQAKEELEAYFQEKQKAVGREENHAAD